MVDTEDKGKIVVVKGISQYNVLNFAAEQMAKSFEGCGYRVAVLDGRSVLGKEAEILSQEMNDNGKFIFIFNPIFYDTMVNKHVSLFDNLGCPVFTYLVDSPYYHIERLEHVNSHKIYLGCVDYNHVTYINRYHANIRNAMFLPHFGFRAPVDIPYGQREIDLYFPGSYADPQKRAKDIDELPDVLCHIARVLIPELLSDKKLTLDRALTKYLDSIKFDYEANDIPELIYALVCVDQYIRDYHRHSVITEILNAGISLTVSGAGWSELKEQYPQYLNILSEEGMDIEENLTVIANSKILLNVLPTFQNGTHERVFTAMMNGCICLTNDNHFFKVNFEENKEIVYYDIDNLKRLPGIIQDILDQPAKAVGIAEGGRQRIQGEYGFDNLAKQILSFMGCEK